MSQNSESMPFEARVYSKSGVCFLKLRGELDFAAAPSLMAVLDRELPRAAPEVVFDLAGVTFVDVAGARALMRAVDRATSVGGTPWVVATPPPVQRVLGLLGIAEHLRLGFRPPDNSEPQLLGA